LLSSLEKKHFEKKTSIRDSVKKGCGFLNMADCSVVGLQESCYPHCARGLYHFLKILYLTHHYIKK
jgi:hypothetical protein